MLCQLKKGSYLFLILLTSFNQIEQLNILTLSMVFYSFHNTLYKKED